MAGGRGLRPLSGSRARARRALVIIMMASASLLVLLFNTVGLTISTTIDVQKRWTPIALQNFQQIGRSTPLEGSFMLPKVQTI
ncbi:unnamed protein product [Calypogeia fissa]